LITDVRIPFISNDFEYALRKNGWNDQTGFMFLLDAVEVFINPTSFCSAAIVQLNYGELTFFAAVIADIQWKGVSEPKIFSCNIRSKLRNCILLTSDYKLLQ